MQVTEKQKEKQLGLVDEIGLDNILTILGNDQGFNKLALHLYEAVATQAQELEVTKILPWISTNKTDLLQESIDDLQALAAKLEPVSAYGIDSTVPKARDHEAILAANNDFSLDDILLTFMLHCGVNKTTNCLIKITQGLADHYTNLFNEVSKAKPSKLPGQELYTHEIYKRKADRFQTLSNGLKSVLVTYQTNKGTPLQEFIATLDKQEKEILATN